VTPPALDGLRVVEIGRSDAARYCGMLFADFGATVAQVRDLHADWQPHGAPEIDYFGRMLDRGKLVSRETVNADGYLDHLHRWIEDADVLIDGSSHGGLPAAGLPYAVLRERYPALVIAALSLTGREGPSVYLDGCELIAAARASDLQMTGIEERPPTRSVSPKAEIYAGLLAFCGAMARLRLSGAARGGLVDVAYADAMLAAMEGRVEHFFESGRVARRVGIHGVGYGIYPAADGYVAIGVSGTDTNWRKFCQAAERPDLAVHPLLREQASRRQYPELVEAAVSEWLEGRTREEVLQQLRPVGLHATAVQTVAEVTRDPQVAAMDLIVEGGDGTHMWRCGGYPIELSRTPAVQRPAQPRPDAPVWPPRDSRTPVNAPTVPPGTRPLTGLTVLEFGSGIAGPYGAMVLSDLGARVIKVEDPANADPKYLNFCGSRRRNGRTEVVLAGSYRERNKESLLIDLRVDGAHPAIEQLIAAADVVLVNLAPGVMERYGLGEDAVMAAHPDMIYASITTFGTRGPLAGLRGVDLLALAHSGFASLTGFPEDPPTRSGQSWSDYLSGLALASGILTALYERDRSGVGQTIRTCLIGMAITTLGGCLEAYLDTEIEPERLGNHSQRFGDRCAVWRAEDGQYVAIDVTAPAALQAFQKLAARGRTIDPDTFDLAAELAAFTSSQPASEVVQRLTEAGVPAAVAGDLRQTASLADFWTRGMFLPWTHATYGDLVMTGSPLRLDRTGLTLRNSSPWPGANSDAVLREVAGLSEDAIAALRASGAIRDTGLGRRQQGADGS
jgi:crotonobetainyl-CoA:carnitine CoA-transferase CaiB-like acyl-CoA transferase